MKLIQRITYLALFSGALVFAQSASAYVQLTYNSNPLHFIQGYLGGEPDDVGSDEPPYPSFSVLFDNISKSTSNQPLGNTADVNLVEWPLFKNVPITTGNVTLDESGIPTAWNFSMQLKESIPGIREGEFNEEGEFILEGEYQFPSETSWLFESSYGVGTCNCEKFRYDYDIYIERAYYSWAYANTIGFVFGGESSPSRWSVTTVDVPEPKTYLLFALGLIIMGVRKMRFKNVI